MMLSIADKIKVSVFYSLENQFLILLGPKFDLSSSNLACVLN